MTETEAYDLATQERDMIAESEMSLVVPFVDESGSFAHGFEAGIIWEMMERDQHLIDRTVRIENEQVLQRMAFASGYSAAFAGTDVEGWLSATFRKVGAKRYARSAP